MPGSEAQAGHVWLLYALCTVASWGLYGVFLHSGQLGMSDPASGRYKAFLWVGIAYFLIAVLAPLALLVMSGASWSMPTKGIAWSLLAGTVGAIGAFCVLVAFGKGGNPAVVMSIIFAGAPVVNAFVAMGFHPPPGGLSSIRWQFVLGIALAALGGTLVTLYKPGPGKPSPPPSVEEPR